MPEDTASTRILIVEDELVVASDLEASLQELGYVVVRIAASGPEAISLAERNRPDLVLMDIQLRGAMDGVQTAQELRHRWQLPVIFATANTNEDMVSRARVAAPYGYLMKPFRTQELNATIRMALHQHHLVRDLFTEHTWLSTILGSIRDGVIATDAGGYVRYLNPAAETYTGWTLGEAVGQPIESVYPLCHLNGNHVGSCQLRKALDELKPIAKERFLLCRRSGRAVPVEDAAAPVMRDGRAIGAVTVFVDISERLREERLRNEERSRLEQQMELTSQALGQTREDLRALSDHLMTAQEDERRRVARELHDDLAQRTTLASFEAARLSYLLLPKSAEAEALAALRIHLDALSRGLREVSHRLHPSVIADLGLPAALRSLADEYQRLGVDAHLVVRDIPETIPLKTATALYRIVQEALRNVAKHAPDAPVQVLFTCHNQNLDLQVEDAGPGFVLEDVLPKGGLGLLSMQERARLAGGSLTLRSQPGEGTRILVCVPWQGTQP